MSLCCDIVYSYNNKHGRQGSILPLRPGASHPGKIKVALYKIDIFCIVSCSSVQYNNNYVIYAI